MLLSPNIVPILLVMKTSGTTLGIFFQKRKNYEFAPVFNDGMSNGISKPTENSRKTARESIIYTSIWCGNVSSDSLDETLMAVGYLVS